MNSSGIKRGLAATAVAALAVTGLPFLASSASAASSDEMKVVYTGPFRDGGNVGGLVVLETKGITAADLRLAGTDITKTANAGGNQAVTIAGTSTLSADEAKAFGVRTGYTGIAVRVTADTRNEGDAVGFTLYEDEDRADSGSPVLTGDRTADVDLNEKYAAVSGTTAGAPASISVTPTAQSAPANVDSGDFTVTVRDAQGRTTQLNQHVDAAVGPPVVAYFPGERVMLDNQSTSAQITTASTAGAAGDDVALSATDLIRGVASFTAKSGTATVHSIDAILQAEDATPGYDDIDKQAVQLDVTKGATITAPEVDFVTAADNWFGYGDAGSATPKSLATGVSVRADQKSVEIKFKSTDPNTDKNGSVSLTATGTNLTFDGGKDKKTYTTTLNGDGVGSIVITPDASSIKDNSSIALSGAFTSQIQFDATALTGTTDIAPDATNYVSKFGGSVQVVAQITDQFGQPVTSGYITVEREDGVNDTNTESDRVAVNANGEATFTLTDTKATATSKKSDKLTFRYYDSQFASTALSTASKVATIDYTADGTGGDFLVSVDGVTASGTAYDPAAHTTLPLTDAIAEDTGGAFPSINADEYVNLGIIGGTSGAPVTVSVNNDALILKSKETKLTDGSATDTGVMNSTAFRIVGTKVGLTTVTITSAGVTKTAQFTVKQAANPAGTARNIAVTGPEKAVSGEVAAFEVKVTDAFGNGVAGYKVDSLNMQVGGPGRVRDYDAVTDANGVAKVNVELDRDAASAVSLRVRATANSDQFGAAANKETASPTADDAPGLTASVSSASASIDKVTDLSGLEQAVADAQAAVDAAQDKVDAAKGDLMVAKAERSVAQKAVKQAKKELRQAKKHHKGVKAARKALREARGDKRVANAKVSVAQAKVNRANEDLAAAQADLAAAQQALEDAQK